MIKFFPSFFFKHFFKKFSILKKKIQIFFFGRTVKNLVGLLKKLGRTVGQFGRIVEKLGRTVKKTW
jgi:hypothetical protein